MLFISGSALRFATAILAIFFLCAHSVFASAGLAGVSSESLPPEAAADVLKPDDPVFFGCLDIYEMLEKVSYMKVRKQGFLGSDKFVSVKGAQNRQIKFALDGVLLEGLDGKTSILAAIPLSCVDKVVIYSSGGFFGGEKRIKGTVIDIVTKTNSSPEPKTDFGFEYQRFDTLRYNLGFDVSNLGNGAVFFADRRSSTGYRENENYLGESVFGKLRADFNNAGSLVFTAMMSFEDKGTPGPNNTPLYLWGDDLERRSFTPNDNSEYDRQFGSMVYSVGPVKSGVYGSTDEILAQTHSGGTETNYLKNTMQGVFAQLNMPFGIVSGVEIRKNRYFGKDYLTNTMRDELSVTENRFYFSDSQKFKFYNLDFGADLSSIKGRASHFCPFVMLNSEFSDILSMFAGASKDARYPSAEEFVSNSMLDAEKHYVYEAGAAVKRGGAVLKTAVFSADYKDTIQPDNAQSAKYNSDGIYRSQGVVSSLNFNAAGLRNRISYTLQKNIARETNKTKAYSPARKLNYDITYGGFENTQINISVYALSAQYADEANTIIVPGRALADIMISRKIHSSIFYAGFKNIADKRFVQAQGYPLPGKMYYAGVNISFLN